MESILFPGLAAVAVLLLVYGASQIIIGFTDPEKRKLKMRLSAEHSKITAASQQNIQFQQADDGAMAVALTRFTFFDNLNRMLLQAYPDMTFSRFVVLALSIGGAIFGIVFAFSGSLLVAAIAGAIGIYAPCVWLSRKRSKRQRMLADQLPEALDFLSRILKAGHSLSTGLQMMAEELPQPLAGEFRRAYDQHSLGSPMDECLKDTANRIESTDFAFFVTAVLIQRQTGGDLSEVLNNISGMIRQRIRLQQHVKAKTAEGRFTGYILSAFPAVMFVIAYILNPDYAGVLIKTNLGLMLLGTAFGLQLLGLYCIQKITTVVV
ncbi:MAG TPA: type II secretion system F family protein [Tepidisphaeraceae bacterium]|nr:type II secretion system F family protein [Tepidisphaeraceae bacterium]